MNLILHLPKTEKGRQKLQKQVSTTHAEAISLLLQKLSSTQAQKEKLLQEVDAHLKK